MHPWVDLLATKLGSPRPSTRPYEYSFNCPFCPRGDRDYHLGVNTEKMNKQGTERGLYNCFRCGAGGSIRYLFSRLNIPWPDELLPPGRLEGFARVTALLTSPPPPKTKHRVDYSLVPGEDYNPFLFPGTMGHQYLLSRGLSSVDISHYRIGEGLGRYWGRVIFPEVDDEGRMIFYQARSYLGRNPKYLSPSGEKDYHIWNYSPHRSRVVVAEGIISAIMSGPEGQALYSYNFLPGQVEMLVRADYDEYILLFDGETRATKKVYALAQQLYAHGIKEKGRIKIAVPPVKLDPGDLGKQGTAALIASAVNFRPEGLVNSIGGLLDGSFSMPTG